MARQNYTEILNLLRGLNDDEIKQLQKHLVNRIQTSEKAAPFEKSDGRYVEVKCIHKKRKDGTPGKPNYYKYYRWREDGKLKNEYIGKASQSEYETYQQKCKRKSKNSAVKA